MTSYIKGIYSYIKPGTEVSKDEVSESVPTSPVTSSASSSPTIPDDDDKKKDQPEAGYLKRAVTGVAGGIYSVGAGTVGVGVSSVKWVAGTTYNVGAGVVTTAGSVVGKVGSGATAVISKVSTTSKKEHAD
ncbi:uncharacterized protein LOC143038035 [Oratosquilla oratoria]|uniref:uncharacterized protein LOC143038035 n=1 Tax=Oratosquilla oratoria TaxID=337810 RepID=UPI003F769D97